MALIFMDGVDQFTTITDLGLKWGTQSGNVLSTTLGRFGGHCIDQGFNDLVSHSFTAGPTMLCGGAFIFEGTNPGNSAEIVKFMEGSTTHSAIEIVTGGFIRSRLGLVGAVHATSANPVIKQNTWHWIEVQMTISNTVGQVTVDVDGINVINTAANLDTQSGGTANTDKIEIRTGGSNGRWDDFYIATPTGGQITSFIGDARIDNIMPDGAGNYTEFGAETPGASTHWQVCDEIGPDGDSSKITSTAANQRDTFTHANLSAITSQTIHAVQQTAYAKHDGTATNFRTKLRRVADHNGVSQAGGASYGYFREVWEQDPQAGPGAWTETNVNATEGGVESL
jgi:hypothetical protein